ncbi:MAG: RNA polymerase sigma factor [Chitinispirillaceae bacterium]
MFIKTETEAITLCLEQKNPAGFDFLVKLFRREAFFHALGFLGNSDDAADACQEAFTKAFSAMPHLKKLDSFYPWFYTILRNHCLNNISRIKTAREKADDVAAEHYSNCFDPGAVLEKQEESQAVWSVLGELDAEFREILVLKYLREMDYEGISRQLGIPRGTVMSRLYYARKAFSRCFKRLAPEMNRYRITKPSQGITTFKKGGPREL